MFSDTNVLQGSVTIYIWSKLVINNRTTLCILYRVVRLLITNLLHICEEFSSGEKVKIGLGLTELWPRVCGLMFLAHPVQ